MLVPSLGPMFWWNKMHFSFSVLILIFKNPVLLACNKCDNESLQIEGSPECAHLLICLSSILLPIPKATINPPNGGTHNPEASLS